jgi:hypothetical protein
LGIPLFFSAFGKFFLLRRMKHIITFLLATVLIISVWFCTPYAVSNSYSSSAEYLYSFSERMPLISLLIAFLLIVLIRFFRLTNPFIFVVVLCAWLLVGRYVYYKEFESGTIGASFYFVSTGQIDLCDSVNQDCESLLVETDFELLPFWRIRFSNKYVNKTIFVGPIGWSSFKEILKKSLIAKKLNKPTAK